MLTRHFEKVYSILKFLELCDSDPVRLHKDPLSQNVWSNSKMSNQT